MAYIPLAQLKKRETGYIPVSQLRGEQEVKERSTLDFNLGKLFGTKTTTPAFIPKEAGTLAILGGLAKEVGQSVARNIGSAGMTIATAIASKEAKPFIEPLKAEDFQSYFGQALVDTVFGEGQEVKSIEQRIAEAQPKIEEWQKEMENVSKTPGLNARERFITKVLANLDAPSVAFTGIMGSVGLDLTPFGGLEKNAYTALRKANTLGDAMIVLKKMGVADDLIRQFAEEVVKIQTDDAAKILFNKIANIQQTTKVQITGKGYRPVAELRKEKTGVDEALESMSSIYKAKASGQSFPVRRFEYGETRFPAGTQDKFEPKGTYYAFHPSKDIVPELPRGAKSVKLSDIKFENPLVVSFENWKVNVSKQFGGLRGEALSKEIGKTYDGIITTVEGKPHEIVDLSAFKKADNLTTSIKPPTGRQLDELAKRVKELGGKSKEEITPQIQELSDHASFLREQIEEMPGRKLKHFISRKEGQFLDLPEPTGKMTVAQRNSLLEREKKIYNAAESAFEGTHLSDQFDNLDVIKNAIEEYDKAKVQLKTIQENMSALRESAATILKGERAASIGMQQRRMQYRAVQGRYTLTDNEMKRFLHGRNISAMDKDEWQQFIAEADKFGEQTEKHTNAMAQLKYTIQEKELKNWENVQAALDLPPISRMNVEQLENFELILSQFKTGDEFLPVKMMQTLSNTELAGVKTTREVLDVLAKRSGKTIEDVEKIKATEWHRTLGDRRLAQQNPFYEVLVERKNRGFVEANARVVELTDELDELVKRARVSRERGMGERLIPTDENIVRWAETIDEDVKRVLEGTMTKEELAVAKRWDEIRRSYYDYFVKRHAEEKFSRFEGQYFPHVRRGFLEAWKEDGVLNAFKEMRDKYRQDAFTMDILNEQTKEILPYEKWIGFAQFRSGNLIPTKNAAKAFEAYITALEKARHLDAMTPEIMAYVHTLSPRNFSQHGVELDTSLDRK